VKLVVSPGPPLTLGSYAPRSHRVVDMAGCRVNARALTAVARTLAGLWSRAGLPVFADGVARAAVTDVTDGPDGVDGAAGRSGLRYVLLREVRSGAIQISLVLGEPLPHDRLQPIVDGLRAAHPQIESVVLHLNPTRSNTLLPDVAPSRAARTAADAGAEPASEGTEAEDSLGRSEADQSLLGPLYLWEELVGAEPLDAAAPVNPAEAAQARKMIQEPLRLRVSARSFLQVNRGLAARLYSDVARAIALRPDEAILDLYCGVSGLGRTVLRTQPASHLFGIEWSQSAIADAAASAEADGLRDRASFFCGSVADRLPEALRAITRLGRPYVTLLNPPRRGCEPAVLRALLHAEVRPRAIAYVSCSPSSLARDLSVLLQAGYELSAVTPYDMHPGTPHIETVAILQHPQ
jgi:23S rRNA (uracil1939-C5)-methyltransferase